MERTPALGADMAQHLAENGAEHAVDQGQLQGVRQGQHEVPVLEDAWDALHVVGISLSDPVVQHEVLQGIGPLRQHAALHDEDIRI